MRRKRKLEVTVRIVPQGALKPNDKNPHFTKSPQQRRDEIVQAIGEALARSQPATGDEKDNSTPRRPITSEIAVGVGDAIVPHADFNHSQ